MSLALNSNTSALTAHRALSGADHNLSKSINRLSTGLRINGAADDPSGLAISQRLQTQYRGLDRAIMNSHDAISYLQTAESALNETQSILQRMRELSIQAANGTLTASDRQEVQKEVDQLKMEVDRIATSTEFNTKRLLDGSASVLWSTSSDDVGVVVRGKAKEGNYELEIDTDPVENHVLKTDIFKTKEAALGVSDVDLNATNAIYSIAGAGGNAAGTLTFEFGSGSPVIITVAGTETNIEMAALINQNDDLNQYVRAIVHPAPGTGYDLEAVVPGVEGNAFSVQASGANVAFIANGLEHSFTGGVNTPSGIEGVGTLDGVPASDGVSGDYRVWVDNEIAVAVDTINVVASYEQTTTDTISAASTPNSLTGRLNTATNVVSHQGSGYAIIEVTKGGVEGATGTDGQAYGRMSFDNGLTWVQTGNLLNGADATLTSDDGLISFELSGVAAASGVVYNAGDKMLLAFNDNDFNASTHAAIRIDTPFTTGITDLTTAPTETQIGPTWAFTSDTLDDLTKAVDVGYLNTETGDISFGSVDIQIGDMVSNNNANTIITAAAEAGTSFANSITFDVNGSSGPAFGTTKLWQIDKFYDVDGNFILGTSGKYISIYNEAGSKAEIFIDPEDTIDEVADKIENAVINDTKDGGLGMGTGNASIDSHVADFVVDPVPGTDEALAGTMIIRSPWMGDRGKLYFSAEEEILNALSLATINTPDIDPMTITVRDAHTGELIGKDTVADSVLHNVIEGVDIELNPNLDVDINWDPAKKEYIFTNAGGTVKEYVHIVDNAKSFQIGASEGQIMESFIGEMTANALGINNVMVIDQGLAQNAMTKLSDAIDRVSSERSRMGSVINRLDHTINNLTMQKESAFSSDARIKDLDIAKESVEFARYNMMTQAAQSMLAQANKMPQQLLQLLRG